MYKGRLQLEVRTGNHVAHRAPVCACIVMARFRLLANSGFAFCVPLTHARRCPFRFVYCYRRHLGERTVSTIYTLSKGGAAAWLDDLQDVIGGFSEGAGTSASGLQRSLEGLRALAASIHEAGRGALLLKVRMA